MKNALAAAAVTALVAAQPASAWDFDCDPEIDMTFHKQGGEWNLCLGFIDTCLDLETIMEKNGTDRANTRMAMLVLEAREGWEEGSKVSCAEFRAAGQSLLREMNK